MGYTAVAVFR